MYIGAIQPNIHACCCYAADAVAFVATFVAVNIDTDATDVAIAAA